MAKFTIKDLAEGKCAVRNDGTVEELNKVLKAAFPNGGSALGSAIFYTKFNNEKWIGLNCSKNYIQPVKDFLEELESPKLPKRGDRILIWNLYEGQWTERIFITYIEGAKNPIVCVTDIYEKEFNSGEPFGTTTWDKWKPIPEKKVLEVTLEDIAKKYEVDEVKIVEKKG